MISSVFVLRLHSEAISSLTFFAVMTIWAPVSMSCRAFLTATVPAPIMTALRPDNSRNIGYVDIHPIIQLSRYVSKKCSWRVEVFGKLHLALSMRAFFCNFRKS